MGLICRVSIRHNQSLFPCNMESRRKSEYLWKVRFGLLLVWEVVFRLFSWLPDKYSCLLFQLFLTVFFSCGQWCGLRPVGLRTRPVWDKKKSVLVLVLHAVVLVLQVWCFVKQNLVILVVMMILKDTTFQVLFVVSLFCAWNITTVEINSGVHLKVKSAKCFYLFLVVLTVWWYLSWSCYFGLGLKNLFFFTSLAVVGPVAPKPHSQAFDTETWISAGLSISGRISTSRIIAAEVRPPLVCDLKTMKVVGSGRLTSPEWITTVVGADKRVARAKSDSHGRVLRPWEVTGAVFLNLSDILALHKQLEMATTVVISGESF